mgnify:CR=1 FL=1
MPANIYLRYVTAFTLLFSNGACHQVTHKGKSHASIPIITQTAPKSLSDAPTIKSKIVAKKTNKTPKTKIVKKRIASSRTYPNPSSLYGAPSSKIRDLFGSPDFLRTDYPAHYWHYKLKTCTLDFFFYPQKSRDDTLIVTHFQGRGATDIIFCLKTAVDRHLDKQEG